MCGRWYKRLERLEKRLEKIKKGYNICLFDTLEVITSTSVVKTSTTHHMAITSAKALTSAYTCIKYIYKIHKA